jgi:hypothetical protein
MRNGGTDSWCTEERIGCAACSIEVVNGAGCGVTYGYDIPGENDKKQEMHRSEYTFLEPSLP